MESQNKHPVFVRLGQALQAIGAHHAARRLELAQSLFEKRDDTGIRSLALRHCREYGLDATWILQGQGQGPDSAGLPPDLTPVFAMTSVHPRTGRWRLEEVERIALSPEILSPTRFVTRMDSRALEPRLRLGAYLVVDTALDRIPGKDDPDAALAVDVRGEGLVVRMARYDRRSNMLELAALDRTLPPLVVPCGEPESRVVGRVVWVAQAL